MLLKRHNLRLGKEKHRFLIRLVASLLALTIFATESAIAADTPGVLSDVQLYFDSQGLGNVTYRVGTLGSEPDAIYYSEVYLYDEVGQWVGQCLFVVISENSEQTCEARLNQSIYTGFILARVTIYDGVTGNPLPGLDYAESPPVAIPFPSCPADNQTIQNGSFENFPYYSAYTPTPDGGSDNLRQDCFKLFWKTTASDHQVEIWNNSVPVQAPFSAAAGVQYAELNANEFGGLYQDITTVPGTRMRWKLQHAGRNGSSDSMKVLIGTPETGGETTRYTAASGAEYFVPGTFPYPGGETATRLSDTTTSTIIQDNSTWGTWSGVYTVPAGQTVTRFLFISYSSPNGGREGNLLDDISFEPTLANNDTATINNIEGGSFDVSVNDFPRDETGTVRGTFSASGSTWPAGISIDSSTGVVTVTQDVDIGSYTLQYLLTNQIYPTDTSIGNIYLTVEGISRQSPPVTSCVGAGSLINGSFENFAPIPSETWTAYGGGPNQVLQLNQSRVTGWLTTASDSTIEIQRQVSGSGQDGTFKSGAYFDTKNIAPAAGSYWAELNANQVATLYQSISTIPGSTIQWSIKHRGRRFSSGSSSNATDRMIVKIGASIASADTQTASAAHGSVRKFSPIEGLWSTSATPTYPTYSATPSSTPPLLNSDGFMDDALEDGWVLYKGTYVVPAGQSTTVFAFQALSPSSSFGNFLDDIQFSPLIACPATLTVVAGRQVTISPFDIDSSGNPLGNDLIDSYGWDDAFVTETLTATSGTVGRASVAGVANRAITFAAPSTVGAQTISFQIANPQGDTSRSTYTINVIADSRTRAPSDVPIDPRTTAYNFKYPQVTTTTSQVIACVRQSDSSGAIISGTLRFDVGTRGTSQTTINYGSESVTVSNDISNTLNIAGPITAVNRALSGLWVTRSDSPARLNSRFYVQVSSIVTGLVLYSPNDCNTSVTNQIRVTTLKPITLTQTRRIVVAPRNGRQNN